jgi:hypothetical protein
MIAASSEDYISFDSLDSKKPGLQAAFKTKMYVEDDDMQLVDDYVGGKRYCNLYLLQETKYKKITGIKKKNRNKQTIFGVETEATYDAVLEPSELEPSEEYSAEPKLFCAQIYRTPIFSKLDTTDVALSNYNATDSFYLSGLRKGVGSDKFSPKEQANVLTNDVLKNLATLRENKDIYLYARDNKGEYSKVSLSKGVAQVADTSIKVYINPISDKNRSNEESNIAGEIKKELQDKIDEKERNIKSVGDSTDESLQTCAAINNTTTDELVKKKDDTIKNQKKELEKANADLAKFEDNKAKAIQERLNYGKEIDIETLKTEYILIISTKDWYVAAAPAGQQTVVPQTKKRVFNFSSIGKIFSRNSSQAAPTVASQAAQSNGGRRKTKKSNKKSRKQSKSKKQTKSRKLFKRLLY